MFLETNLSTQAGGHMQHLLRQLSCLGSDLAVAQLHLVHALQQNCLLLFARLKGSHNNKIARQESKETCTLVGIRMRASISIRGQELLR